MSPPKPSSSGRRLFSFQLASGSMMTCRGLGSPRGAGGGANPRGGSARVCGRGFTPPPAWCGRLAMCLPVGPFEVAATPHPL